jgi:hypothetical protein
MIYIILFLLLGIVSLGIVVLEDYAGLQLIMVESRMEKDAIHSILTVMGILGICTSGITLYLIQEKRNHGRDRRKASQATDFEDRRKTPDRREI